MDEAIRDWESLADLAKDADHIDVKTIESDVDFRSFVHHALTYMPVWLKALYWVRGLLAWVLRIKQADTSMTGSSSPDDLPMKAGIQMGLFQVKDAEEGRLWLGGITESHLTAHLAFVREEQEEGPAIYKMFTFVHFHHWTGRLYFKIITPGHHLVVGAMLREGARSGRDEGPWLSSHAGAMLMWIAVIHTVVGLMIFTGPLQDIVQAGVFDTVKPPFYDRGVATWFLLSGFLLLMLGSLMRWAYQQTRSLPRSLGWGGLGFSLLGVALMPVSGFWLMLPVCVGILQAPKPPVR